MLIILFTISFTLFGCLYPFYFWTIESYNMDKGFHRLNLGLSSFIGSLGVILYWFMDLDFHTRLPAVVWLVSLLAVTQFYWNRDKIQRWVVTIPSVLGVIVYFQMISVLVSNSLPLLIISLVGGLILAGSVFAMVMGHWLLNVLNLPIGLLRRITILLVVFLILRFGWDAFFIFTESVDVNYEIMLLTEFIQSFNGFFLFIAMFFGTVLPLAISFFILHTIVSQLAQPTTGLLYVLAISVLMGDLFYKYFFLQYGLYM